MLSPKGMGNHEPGDSFTNGKSPRQHLFSERRLRRRHFQTWFAGLLRGFGGGFRGVFTP